MLLYVEGYRRLEKKGKDFSKEERYQENVDKLENKSISASSFFCVEAEKGR